MSSDRWGSLAIIGRPESVRSPPHPPLVGPRVLLLVEDRREHRQVLDALEVPPAQRHRLLGQRPTPTGVAGLASVPSTSAPSASGTVLASVKGAMRNTSRNSAAPSNPLAAPAVR